MKNLRHLLRALVAAGLGLASLLAQGHTGAEAELRLGIFAYRPRAIMEVEYQPLADYLSHSLPHTRVRLRVMEPAEMEQALREGQLDLLFTNPSHFLVLRHQNRLSGAIATLVALENGQPTSLLGGVLIARSDRDDLNTLADVRGQRLVAPGTKFLGGYQTQAYELLQAGIRLPQDVRSLTPAANHDGVVTSILAGEADVGFIRTGVLEALTREGKLRPGDLKVINRQTHAGFPMVASTRLYPEWAFAALPHVDAKTARRVASALLAIEPDSAVAKAAGIYGFTVPADYQPVENLARALRLPPFAGAPEFTLHDVLSRYRWPILGAALAGLLIAGLGLSLVVAHRRLRDSATAHRTVLNVLGEGVFEVDHNGRISFINPAALALLGYNEADLLGQDAHALLLPHRADGSGHPPAHSPILRALREKRPDKCEEWLVRRDGSGFMAAMTVTPELTQDEARGAAIAFHDITERNRLQTELRALATTDSLTGLPNRRHFLLQLEQEQARLGRFPDQVAALLMLDIDHFKKVNDEHGHGAGDAVLQGFARCLQATLCQTDVAGRLGGEEFAVLLPGACRDTARQSAERLRLAVKALRVDYGGQSLGVTVSIGLTQVDHAPGAAEAALTRADQALYRAKANGRDRVEAA